MTFAIAHEDSVIESKLENHVARWRSRSFTARKPFLGVERIVAGTPSSTISRGLNPCELTRSIKADAPAGVSTRRVRDKEIALKRILVLYSYGALCFLCSQACGLSSPQGPMSRRPAKLST